MGGMGVCPPELEENLKMITEFGQILVLSGRLTIWNLILPDKKKGVGGALCSPAPRPVRLWAYY